MSNRSIAARIAEVVAAYERGHVAALAVAESVELHEPAFEALSRSVRDDLHRLSAQIVAQDTSPLESEMLGLQSPRAAVASLKAILEGIQ
jgi:hypothetical protein